MMADRQEQRRVIRLGSGRRLTLRDYVMLWKQVKIAVDQGVKALPCDLEHPFDHRSEQPASLVLAQFRRGLHDRINRRGDAVSGGRKCDPDWQRAAIRVAAFVNGDPRCVWHPGEWRWIPHELRRAFARREAD